MSDTEKAAIVAELERLYDQWHEKTLCRDGMFALNRALGMCDGLDLAIQVVQAGGALPPETQEEANESIN